MNFGFKTQACRNHKLQTSIEFFFWTLFILGYWELKIKGAWVTVCEMLDGTAPEGSSTSTFWSCESLNSFPISATLIWTCCHREPIYRGRNRGSSSLILCVHQNHLENLLKHRFLASPSDSDSIGLRWCLDLEFLGSTQMMNVAGSGTTFWEHWLSHSSKVTLLGSGSLRFEPGSIWFQTQHLSHSPA